jgi:hypothetical protein
VTDNTGVQGITVNGNGVTVNVDGSFSYALLLNEGANIITTVATDLAGNQAVDTRTITLDITAPTLVITAPADNSKTAVSTSTVTGTIDENSTVTVILNGGTPQYASITGNTFTLDIVLTTGINTIEITATDTADNKTTQKRTVTYDNTKPSIEITEPNQDTMTNQSSMVIKGTVSDTLTAVSVSVTVDGNTYTPTLTNGQFEQTVTFTTEKTYQIIATATDEVGNTTTVQRNIIYDITTPTIDVSVKTPTNTNSQTITGTMEEGVTVTVSSATATIGTLTYPSSTTWSVNIAGMMEGSNTITIKSRDSAGNETTVTKEIVLDTIAPTGSVSINSGATYTTSTAVTLTLSASDNVGVTGYYVSASSSTPSASASGWTSVTSSTSYNTSVSYTLSSGDGNKTVYVWFKDDAGNVSTAYSDSIILDTVAIIEIDPVTSPISSNTQTITGTTETGAIVKVAVNDSTKYVFAAVNGTTWSYKIIGLVEGTNYIYITATDIAGNTTLVFAIIKVNSITLTEGNGISLPRDDTNIQGISRVDGGNDSNNIDSSINKPKVDIEYKFAVVLKDPSGNPPKSVKLYMTQRANPKTTDFYNYDMTCEGDITTGAACSFITKLGPANVHKYHFEAKFADGTDMRFPETGEIEGPKVGLLTGYNMVGIPRDLSGTALDGISAFGSVSSYGWISSGLTTDENKGKFVLVNSTNPVKGGEGYFTNIDSNDTLPALEDYSDVTAISFKIGLKPGWNLISNPYGGNVKLIDMKVQRVNESPVTWEEATNNKWLNNAIYYYNGSDWGKTYFFESAGGSPDATLIPWIGYWIYVGKDDVTYSIIIPKPE